MLTGVRHFDLLTMWSESTTPLSVLIGDMDMHFTNKNYDDLDSMSDEELIKQFNETKDPMYLSLLSQRRQERYEHRQELSISEIKRDSGRQFWINLTCSAAILLVAIATCITAIVLGAPSIQQLLRGLGY